MNDPMDYSCLIDGQRVDDTGRMRALVAEEFEGARSPNIDDSGITRFESVRDGGRFLQVRALTPEKLRHMTAVEKRLLHEWVVRICDELDVKAALIARNMPEPVELPDYLREKGAA